MKPTHTSNDNDGTATLQTIPSGTEITLSLYSGAVAFPPQSALDSMSLPAWKQAYYDEVIKVDEERFLVSQALEHIVRVAPLR